jgi:GNAT superfamily N-acetyltransferase
MHIRNFQPGDEALQVDIYNTAAGRLPKFKLATAQEVQRRVRAGDFDPEQRFYAVEAGRVVGYALVNANGRVSLPWCLPDFEHAAPLLFAKVLEAARKRGLAKVFAAYREDWPVVHDFFIKQGFVRARSMVNYLIEFIDMPTPSDRASSAMTPLAPADVPAIYTWMPEALRADGPKKLHDHLFKNPYFHGDAAFALRNRQGEPMAAGIVVYDPSYADPHAVDPAMPCFRLGAFGTEGMQSKRLKGLFSFLARPDASLPALAMDLMAHAAHRLREHDDVTGLAGQAATDAPELLAFYERNFKKQGSFPVFEMSIKGT